RGVVMPTIRVRLEPDLFVREFNAAVELGRQSDASEELYSARLLNSGRWRVVIARLDEDTLSRRHALIEPLEGNSFQITHLSAKVPIRLQDGSDIGAGASRDLSLPMMLNIGRKPVHVEGQARRESILRSLPSVAMLPAKEQVINPVGRFPTLVGVENIEIENV